MSHLQYRAMDALRAALALEPALSAAGVVKALQQPPDRLDTYPSVTIVPDGKFTFVAWQHDEVLDSDGEVVVVGGQPVVEVGDLRGIVRIDVATNYAPEREVIEDVILGAFNQDDTALGRLMATMADVSIAGVATSIDWPVAFLLGDEAGWREEMAFSDKRGSFLQVGLDVSVLILKKDAALITQLVAAISSDLTTAVLVPADTANLQDLEQVLINDDGTLSSYP